MCGIVAYTGKNLCTKFIFNGLSRLEYRGYDSAGIACINKSHKHISYKKKSGGSSLLQDLEQSVKFDGSVGIGHTRWATHGVANTDNAHPHFNCEKNVAVVHNGIIESHEEIRASLLQEGHTLSSTTDSEVIAHVFSRLLKKSQDPLVAAVELVKVIKGAYALAIVMQEFPDQIILVRKRSPLCLGVNDGETFIASDFIAFSDKVDSVCFMPDESIAIANKGSIQLYDFQGESLSINLEKVDQKFATVDKQGFEHYMLKEIYEQKHAITRTVSFCKIIGSNSQKSESAQYLNKENQENEYSEAIWRQLGTTQKHITNLQHLTLVAAGTSWHAARIAQFFFETLCKIPTHVYLASEFQHMPFFPQDRSLHIFISQSGETADTLQALRLVNSFDATTIGITNIASSSIVREASGFLPMQAGPEISVASTKAFSTQLATLYWLANRIALEKKLISWKEMHESEEDLFIAAEVLEATIENYKLKITQELAKKYCQYDRFIFLGRHISYPFALEAALKLKEISYIFSQCYPAGELKHGPIALVDEKTPIVLFSVIDEQIYCKLVSNAQEVKARNGHLVVFAFEGQDELINLADTVFIIPKIKPLLSPLAMTGLMQFFVYQITKELKRPIDKPRNLAKAVTVE